MYARYNTVHAAPSTAAAVAQITPSPALLAAPSNRHAVTPLSIAGNVVANSAVGFGPPEMLTVETPVTAAAVALAELPASRMEKRGEMAYIPPCVLLMKSR